MELIAGAPVFEIHGLKHMQIKGIALTVNDIKEKFLYVYPAQDRHMAYEETIQLAKEKGAVAICIENSDEVVNNGLTFIKTYHCQRFVSAITYKYYGNPARQLNLTGITGSHGKTTIAQMIKSILTCKNESVRVFSEKLGDAKEMEDALRLNQMIYKAGNQDIKTGILECSYTGIVKEFYRHIKFDSIIFTDLYTYFQNHEEDYKYFEVRKTLLDHLKRVKSPIITNNDDLYTMQIRGANTITYGIYHSCDINVCNIELTPESCNFLILLPNGVEEVNMQVSGLYNVYNALAATAWAYSQGIDIGYIKEGLESYKNELTQFNLKSTVDVLVENNLSSDSLISVYETIKSLYDGNIVTVFCLGDEKPIELYEEYAPNIKKYSDECILSSDFFCNKRGIKATEKIAEQMHPMPIIYETDHNKALQQAVTRADVEGKKNVVIVLAAQGYDNPRITNRLTNKSFV
jgi:UDP-N-acetylmuramoyl-L-alanyl-D-glutamate--2,6-diaminopimelate ligase